MVKEDLKNISAIRFNDDSEYKPDTCSTGGDYAFWSIYKKSTDGKWHCSYETSADFEYCAICGSFGHSEYDCKMEEDTETDEGIVEYVNRFCEEHKGDGNFYVEVKTSEGWRML